MAVGIRNLTFIERKIKFINRFRFQKKRFLSSVRHVIVRSLFSVFMLQLGSYRVRYIGTRRTRSGRVTVTARETPSFDSEI